MSRVRNGGENRKRHAISCGKNPPQHGMGPIGCGCILQSFAQWIAAAGHGAVPAGCPETNRNQHLSALQGATGWSCREVERKGPVTRWSCAPLWCLLATRLLEHSLRNGEPWCWRMWTADAAPWPVWRISFIIRLAKQVHAHGLEWVQVVLLLGVSSASRHMDAWLWCGDLGSLWSSQQGSGTNLGGPMPAHGQLGRKVAFGSVGWSDGTFVGHSYSDGESKGSYRASREVQSSSPAAMGVGGFYLPLWRDVRPSGCSRGGTCRWCLFTGPLGRYVSARGRGTESLSSFHKNSYSI